MVSSGMGGSRGFCEEPEGTLSKTTQPGIVFTHFPQAQVQSLVGSSCLKISAGWMDGWMCERVDGRWMNE